MAAINVSGWLPEAEDSSVITKVRQVSVIESTATQKPMTTLVKGFPRSSGADVAEVAKSGVYGEDSNTHDEILLTTKKFGRVFRIAEEDIDDNVVNVIETKKGDYATAYAKFIDNACFGVTAAPGAGVPFTSIYRSLTTANAATGYTANANYTSLVGGTTGAAAVLTYDALSDLFALVESGDYFDEARIMVAAHPRVKGQLRKIKDGNSNPVFVDAVSQANPATLFGYPLKWSLGARTNATASANPTGNPLVIAYNADYVYLGVRSGPESVLIPGKDGTAALTDESILKVRTRRAFGLANEFAAAVLELKVGP